MNSEVGVWCDIPQTIPVDTDNLVEITPFSEVILPATLKAPFEDHTIGDCILLSSLPSKGILATETAATVHGDIVLVKLFNATSVIKKLKGLKKIPLLERCQISDYESLMNQTPCLLQNHTHTNSAT